MKVFIDADDTIMNSSKTVVDILNNKYGLSKTVADVKDWCYRSIYPGMTPETVLEIYDSDEFFTRVKLDRSFINFHRAHLEDCEFVVVTKGTKINLEKKKKFLSGKIKGKYAGLIFDRVHDFNKSIVDMRGGIQVDDRMDCLINTNAAVKILLTHGRSLPWNQVEPNVENLYVVNNWHEAAEVIEFFLQYPDYMQ